MFPLYHIKHKMLDCCVLSCSVVSDSLQPMDCSLPSSSVHRIPQAKIRGSVTIFFSRGSSWPRDGIRIPCIAGRFFYCWATRESPIINSPQTGTSLQFTNLNEIESTYKIDIYGGLKSLFMEGFLGPGEGNGNPLQYSCLENPMNRGAWWATVHGLQRVRHDWATSLSLS